MLNIRQATAEDVPTLHSLIQEMAEYEHLPLLITEQILTNDGFGVQAKFRVLIAEFGGNPAGYAFFFDSYSTFQGRGLFLEDLFVRPEFRKNKIGPRLGTAIPGWCGSSIPCVGAWRRRLSPNPAHFALAKLENTLRNRLFVCTQNVDSLHEQAGSRNVVHMHGELFKSRCDTCDRPPFDDTNLYDPPAEVACCECGGRIRPHICWFGEVPFELDRIYDALDACTLFVAIGTSGIVEPAASFVAHVAGRARAIYVGPEGPANASSFTECCLGKAGEVLPNLFGSL